MPKVAVVMGSKSDMDVMQGTVDALRTIDDVIGIESSDFEVFDENPSVFDNERIRPILERNGVKVG